MKHGKSLRLLYETAYVLSKKGKVTVASIGDISERLTNEFKQSINIDVNVEYKQNGIHEITIKN